jgi:hypothetical protein
MVSLREQQRRQDSAYKGQKVHPLIPGLFQKSLDPGNHVSNAQVSRERWNIPSVIPLHTSQTPQVAERASHHPGNTSDTLQEDKSVQPHLLCHLVPGVILLSRLGVPISGYQVHAPTQDTDSPERHPVGPVLSVAMADFDGEHLFFCIAVVRLALVSPALRG